MKKLYIVSIGPGDPELITLKAYKTIQNSDAVCVPTKSENSFERSRAYEITKDATQNVKTVIPVYTPMKLKDEDWDMQVDMILGAFDVADTVSYVTLGDAGVYSTAYYLLEKIAKKAPDIYENTEIIPGITSFSLASARVKKPLCLGEETLHIRPFRPKSTLKTTTVYMRPETKSQNTPNVGKDAMLFQKLSMGEEKISNYNDEATIDEYMSLLVDFADRG